MAAVEDVASVDMPTRNAVDIARPRGGEARGPSPWTPRLRGGRRGRRRNGRGRRPPGDGRSAGVRRGRAVALAAAKEVRSGDSAARGRPRGKVAEDEAPGGEEERGVSLGTRPRDRRARPPWGKGRGEGSGARRRRRGHGISGTGGGGAEGCRGGRGRGTSAVAPARTQRRGTAARDVAVGVAARTTVSRGCRGGRSRGDTEGKHIAAAADAAPTDGAARDGRGHF